MLKRGNAPAGGAGARATRRQTVAASEYRAFGRAAHHYTRRGCPVLALVPGGKTPLYDAKVQPHGSRSATTNPEVIARLWASHPTANVGVATGPCSGIAGVDLDGPHAADALRWAGLWPPPPTFTVHTRRGWHLYVMYDSAIPTGSALLQAACDCEVDSKPKPCGIDARGNGGYLVAPPSIVSGHVYRAIPATSDVPIAVWPEFAAYCAALQAPKPALAHPARGRTQTRGQHNGQSLIEQIKEAWRVEEVAERIGAQLRGHGNHTRAKCPLHGERQGEAFVVWSAEQRWRCFGKCAMGGDVIDLYRAGRERGLL